MGSRRDGPSVRLTRGTRVSSEAEMLERRLLLSHATSAVVSTLSNEASVEMPFQLPQYRLSNQRGSHFLSKPAGGIPLEIGLNYLKSNATKLGVSTRDFDNAIVTNQYTDADTGLTHIYLRQQFNGLEVANADFSINITRDGRVLSVAGGFVANLAAKVSASKALAHVRPAIAAADALGDAAGMLNLGMRHPPTIKSPARFTPGHESVLQAKDISLDDVPARLNYIGSGSGVQLSWKMVIRTPDKQHWYEVNVDSGSGTMLSAVDWIDHAVASSGRTTGSSAPAAAPLPAPPPGDGSGYSVFPASLESPADGARQFVANPADLTYSPFGWHDTNGVAGAEFTDTRGNNVSAQEDADHDNAGGFRPDGTSSLTFNFPFDATKPPSFNQSAAITNLFYWNNFLHDVFANYGFTEAAGNFQVDNYSGQGVGNDAVQADAEDGSGVDLSSFSTPPDGQAPRMQMYLFDKTMPGRDGAFDNQLITHEYAHGVSTRLTGGAANSNSLAAVQSAAMGEGWSDFWAVMFTLKTTDHKTGRYPIGAYTQGQDPITGTGIRRYAYAFDMTADPLTYRSITTSSESHNAGEIWASTLLDLNWLLVDKYGYSEDWSHGYSASNPDRNGGNVLAMKLVMDAMKLQPSNPTFIAGRDAILAADVALTGGANAKEIWTAFARRGMGLTATDGANADSVNITEGFTLPTSVRAPVIITQSPGNGSILSAPVSQISLTFSEAMDPASFSIANDVSSFKSFDNVEHKAQITGFAWLNNNTSLQLTFSPQTTDGQYRLVIGPDILAADDHSAMDQDNDGVAGEATQDAYTARFSFDSLTLHVTGSTPANNAIVTLPFTTLDLDFSEPFDPATVQAQDLVLSRGTVTGAQVLDADTVRYTLSGIAGETNLTFSLAGAAMTDVYGNPNSAYAGALVVDNSTTPFTGAFSPITFAGSPALKASGSTILQAVGDADTFTLPLDAGETFRGSVTPAAGMQAKIDLYNPQNVLLASSSQSGVFTPSVDAPASGDYRIVITALGGSTGTAQFNLQLNATSEVEPSTAGTPQNLNPAFRTTGTGLGGDQVTIVGGTVGGSDSLDAYSFLLGAGQTASVVLNSSSSAAAMKLRGPDGTILAICASNTASSNSIISNFIAPATGTYTVEFGPSSSITYNLGIYRDAGIEVESNDTIQTANPIGSRSLNDSRFLLGNLTAGSSDYYQLKVFAGDVLKFKTSTGNNQQPGVLDAKLVLYGTNQAQIATDDNSAQDGRNALLYYTATANGVIDVQVTGATSAAAGNYVLEIGGATAPILPPTIAVVSPTNGTRMRLSTTAIRVALSDAVLDSSVSPGDLLVDGVPATGGNILDASSIIFTIPPGLAEGNHVISMAAGAITDIYGNSSPALSSSFAVDTTGPRIISTSIQEGAVIPTLTDVVFKLVFDEAINLQFFKPPDNAFNNHTRDGVPERDGVYSFDPATNTLTVTYPTPPDGLYTFTLPASGNGIVDLAGNAMDGEALAWPIPANRTGNGTPGGDFVTNLRIDSVTAALPPLTPIGVPGAGVYTGHVWLDLDSATDVDSFTINLDAGQFLSVVDIASSGEMRPNMMIRDPNGTVIASAVAPLNQSGVGFNGLPITVAGTYTITASVYLNNPLSIGSSEMTITLNAMNNAVNSGNLNMINSAPNHPPAISFVQLPSEPGRFIGSTNSYYLLNFDLAAGDTADVILKPLAGTINGLELDAVSGTNSTAIGSGFLQQGITTSVSRSYSAHVILPSSGQSTPPLWGLTVVKNASIESEPNDTNQTADILTCKVIAGEQAAVGYIDNGDVDRYAIPVTAGATLTLATRTPGDGPGQFNNNLNPQLVLRDATGAVLATDDNSAADGHNANVAYTVLASGTLFVDVLSSSITPTLGEYVLSVTNTSVQTPPTFNATINVPSQITSQPVISISFDRPIDILSVLPAGFLIDGVAAKSVTVSASSVSVTPQILADGLHTITIAAGAVKSLDQIPVQAASASFTLNTLAARIIGSTIQRNDRLAAGDITETVVFDRPLNTSIAQISGATLHGNLTGADYLPDSISFSSDAMTLTIRYRNVQEDAYTLTLKAGTFVDTGGNSIDGETTATTWPIGPGKSGNGAAGGDFAVTFTVDRAADSALPPLQPDGKLGGLVYHGTITGVLDQASDTDTFTLPLEAGQVLSLRLFGATSFIGQMKVIDPQGATVGTFTGQSAALLAAWAQSLALSSGGTYSVIVSAQGISTPTFYTLDVALNAALESESVGGASNNTFASAQSFAMSPVSPSVSRAAVYGTFDASSSTDDYSITLQAGDRLTASLTNGSGSAVVSVLDASGLQLATATGSSSTPGLINSLRAPVDGTYYVTVNGNAGASYLLTILNGAIYETEPNDTTAQAQSIGLSSRVMGRITPGNSGAPVTAEGFEFGMPLSPVWTTFSTRPQGRIQVTSSKGAAAGDYALVMDNGADDSVLTLNEATMTVDLSGQSSAVLSFMEANFGDERQTISGDFNGHFYGDGVSISDDGAHWHPVWTPPTSETSAWTLFTVDLGAEAGRVGMRLGPNFKIRFQQYDDRSLSGADGRGFDAILISSVLAGNDYYSMNLSAGDRITLRTLTPGDGPFQPDNTLDPRLDLYDSNGSLLVSDANSSPDGRNAILNFTAATTGKYFVKISGSTLGSGDYLLDTQGTFGAPGQPDLMAASDTGVSSSDDLTQLNNSAGNRVLKFSASGLTVGADVTLFIDGVAQTTITALYDNETLVTDGTHTLSDGTHVVTVRQQPPGLAMSADSIPLTISIDSVSPAALPVPKLQAASDTGLAGDNITSNHTPAFTITAGNPYVRAYIDGIEVDGYVTGTVYVAPLLLDGMHVMTVVSVDAAGNESAASPPLSFRVIPPEPSTPTTLIDLLDASDSGFSNTDNTTNDNTPTFVLPGGIAGFRVFVNGVPTTTTMLTGSTYTLPTLTEGKFNIAYSVFDAAGGESNFGGSIAVTIDTIVPPATLFLDLDPSADKGNLNNDNITSVNRLIFDYGNVSSPYVRIYRDGVLLNDPYTSVATSYISQPLPDGTSVYTVSSVDLAGNESAQSAGLSITIDTVAPATPTVALDLDPSTDSGVSDSDNITNSPVQIFQIPANINFLTLYKAGVQANIFKTPGSTITYSFSGTYTSAVSNYTYSVTDVAGNESAQSPPLPVTYDTIEPSGPPAPTVDLVATSDTGGSNSDNVTADNTPTFQVTGPGQYFRVFRNGVLISGQYESNFLFTAPPQPDGTVTYTTSSVDAAGNQGGSSPNLTLIIDATPPSSVMQALPTISPAGPIALSWSGQDNIGGVGGVTFELFVSDNGGPFVSQGAPNALIITSFPGQSGHTYRFYTLAHDGVGNVEAPPAVPDATTTVPLPPAVLSAHFNSASPIDIPASLDYLPIHFQGDIQASFSLVDVRVRNLMLGQNITPSGFLFDVNTDTAILTFASGVLLNGNYLLTVMSAGITDGFGTPADGNGDGAPGGDLTLSFLKLMGDVDGDRDVDQTDLQAVTSAVGSPGVRIANGDTNDDHRVDFADLVAIAQNYGNNSTTPVTGDVSGDHKTDFADLVAVAQNYGRSGSADLNRDGIVDQQDVDLVTAALGTSLPAPGEAVAGATAPMPSPPLGTTLASTKSKVVSDSAMRPPKSIKPGEPIRRASASAFSTRRVRIYRGDS